MDAIDQQILRLLMLDGRLSNSKLAKAIGLSESATLERVRRLEASGVIQGYTVRVEPWQVGLNLELFMTFTLKDQHPREIARFEAIIQDMDEVLTCAQTLGHADFLAHIAVKDIQGLSAFINQKLLPLGCIERMESMTVLNIMKRAHPPLSALHINQ
ncbi:Lrp/AsnC family transcriptional regulator [Vampirovibrio sp.]|uniref:Lrp/AsnC family transcriptional regulator n=1 Tax=Vampirovibrio sp. TaxID=2717857 RepID=UPI00359371C9